MKIFAYDGLDEGQDTLVSFSDVQFQLTRIFLQQPHKLPSRPHLHERSVKSDKGHVHFDILRLRYRMTHRSVVSDNNEANIFQRQGKVPDECNERGALQATFYGGDMQVQAPTSAFLR